MVRAPFIDKNGLKKGAWSAEEDEKLRSYIRKYGHWNWRELPKFAGLRRCGKSCRLRWLNYLRPELRLGNFTEEEDALILRLIDQFGTRWSMIAAKLPGRSDNDIKNHWHSYLKKIAKAKPNQATSSSSDQVKDDYSINSVTNSQSSATTPNSDGEAESVLIDIPSHMILESSPLSPASPTITSSSTPESISSFRSDSPGSFSSLNDVGFMDDIFAPSNLDILMYGDDQVQAGSSGGSDSSGDFWSEPFVADNIYNQFQDDYTPSLALAKGGFEQPIILPNDHELYYVDDSLDLLYDQLMREW